MAEIVGETNDKSDFDDKKLDDLFISGWNLYEELDYSPLHSNSTEYQKKVRLAMEHFERATRIVNQISLFSPNELIDEVSTDSLPYMLLPYFLGKLTTKICAPNNIEVIEVGEVYFRDHLQRCSEYELCEGPKITNKNTEQDKSECKHEMQQLMQQAFNRNDKIAQYRKLKELDEYLNRFKVAIKNKTADDEIKREFFLKFLDKSIMDAKQELQVLVDMKEIVKLRQMRIAGGEAATASIDGDISEAPTYSGNPHGHAHNHQHSHAHQPGKPKPLQPFIITRNAAQKAVFGLGYPSLPIMTVDEFYQQRVDDGIFPDEEKVAKMNQAQAIAAAEDPNEKDDQEQAVVEEQIETDDPEYLARARRMDEYKDVVRRGDGNRHNRS